MSPYDWEVCSNQAGAAPGEASGSFVQAEGFPRRAYMKPTAEHDDEPVVCRAAREKIAADLAFDLGLPVPPVQLSFRRHGRSRLPVAVSLVMYPMQWAWEQVRILPLTDPPVGTALRPLLSKASPMLAFDTWLEQTDHGDHPHNIVWGYDPRNLSDSGLIFLDFAFSMGYSGRWRDGGWRTVELAQFPARLLQSLDKAALQATIAGIEGLSESEIRDVVGRIPSSHLPDPQKGLLQEALIGRKFLVRAALARLL